MVFWLRQVSGKDWATNDTLMDLLNAFTQIFSESPKLRAAFSAEVSPHLGQWGHLISGLAFEIRKRGSDSQNWSRALTESLAVFSRETSTEPGTLLDLLQD